MKYIIKTFGCQMNMHDSEKIAAILIENGYSEAKDESSADLILFNTCTVRDHAHHKAISEIGKAISYKKHRPNLKVGVCGCVAQSEKERLFKIYPKLDLVFGPDQIFRLNDLLEACRGGALPPPKLGDHPPKNWRTGNGSPLRRQIATELIDDISDYHWPSYHRTIERSNQRTSALVTIMKGCNNHCSFCIVPSVRGSEVSRPADDIIKEIDQLVKNGVKEVTLLGQNVNSYNPPQPPFKKGGRDDIPPSEKCGTDDIPPFEKGGLGGISPFVQLLKRISAETDILRIRYMSPHPKDLGDDLIEEHATSPKLCRHMHLPLQAGSDRILRLMKRSYNKEQFLTKTAKLRERAVGIDITTDIIVGFPGETEEDFEQTLDVVKATMFDGMYAFKYSPRPGTRSADMKDDVPMKEKDDRLQRLLDLNLKNWKEKTAKLVGTTQDVLVEGISKKPNVIARPNGRSNPDGSTGLRSSARNDTQLRGRTFANKIVNFSGNLNLVGHIVKVKIVRAGENALTGEMIQCQN